MFDGRQNHEVRDRRIWDTLHGRPSQEDSHTPGNSLGVVEDPRQLGLFSDAPMTRNSDNRHSHEAAAKILPKLGKIQREVIEAYRRHGDMTAAVAESLPDFSKYGSSTVRKRISELLSVGILEYVPDSKEAEYRLVEERIDNPLPRVRREVCPACQRAF